jgi:hypothetical protein
VDELINAYVESRTRPLGYVRRLLVLHPKKGVAMPPTTTPSPPPRTST